MATTTCVGNLVCSDGTNIPLKLEVVEGTETSLTTDTVYTVSAINIGDYAPGKTVTHGLVSGSVGVSYAYILRQGVVAANIAVCVKGASTFTPRLWAPFTLQAGDLLKVMTQTASDRGASMAVFTNRGVSRIFHVTPSGGATNELVDIQTGNSIGDTLQGQTCISATFITVDAALIETNGAYIVDALGNVVGSVTDTDPSVQQPLPADLAAPVNLNFKAQFLTSA